MNQGTEGILTKYDNVEDVMQKKKRKTLIGNDGNVLDNEDKAIDNKMPLGFKKVNLDGEVTKKQFKSKKPDTEDHYDFERYDPAFNKKI